MIAPTISNVAKKMGENIIVKPRRSGANVSPNIQIPIQDTISISRAGHGVRENVCKTATPSKHWAGNCVNSRIKKRIPSLV